MWHWSDKAQMHIWPFIHMNLDEDHDEHNNILKYLSLLRISSESWWVPEHVAQDHWSLSNGYKGSRTLYIEIKTSVLYTPLQSIQENNIRVFEALTKTLISQRFQKVFKSVHQYFSYLFKDKSLPPFFSCLI